MTKSKCCSAPIRTAHGCDSDLGHNPCDCLKSGGVTCWNECEKCDQPCDIEGIEMKYKNPLPENPEEVVGDEFFEAYSSACDCEELHCGECYARIKEINRDWWEEELEIKFGEMLNHLEVCLGVSERENLKNFIRKIVKVAYEKGKKDERKKIVKEIPIIIKNLKNYFNSLNHA